MKMKKVHLNAKKQPIRFECELNERIKLIYTILYKAACLKLTSANQYSNNKELKNSFEINLFDKFKQIFEIKLIAKDLMKLIVFFLSIYISIKFQLVSYLLYLHGTLFEELNMQNNHPSSSFGCSLKLVNSNFSSNESSAPILKEFERIDTILKEKFGTMWVPLIGANLFSIAIIGSTPIYFYFLPLIVLKFSKKLHRIDQISFIFNPNEERQRVLNEVKKIIYQLIVPLKDLNNFEFSFIKNYNKTEVLIKTSAIGTVIPKSNQFSKYLMKLYVQFYRGKLTKLSPAEPIVISEKWYRMQLMLIKYLFIVSTYSLYGPYASSLTFTIQELDLLTKQKVNCLNNTNESYFGIFLNELKIYFTPMRFMFLFEVMFMGFCCALWSTFYVSLFVMGTSRNLIWLFQLDGQLVKGNEILNKIANNNKVAISDEKEIFKHLIVTFVNYELFKREHRQSIKLTNLLTAQYGLFSLNASIVCYLIAKYMEISFTRDILHALASVLIFFEANLLMSAFKYEKTIVIGKRIASMIARLTVLSNREEFIDNKEHFLYLMDLWKRQLMTDVELKHYFASDFIGLSITYERFISFNSYIGIILLLLFK